jgi:lysophospholipase L1-like esterase
VRRAPIVLAIALSAALAPLAAARADETLVVTWGDSITYGYFDGTGPGNDCTNGAPDDNPRETCGYGARLASRLDDTGLFWPVYDVDLLNLGKGGEKTAGALSRVDRAAWICPCANLPSNPCPINSLKYWVCNGTVDDQDLFVLMEGTNDIGNYGVETIAFNLGQIGAKAEALGLNVLVGTVVPRHPQACKDSNNAGTHDLNEEIGMLAADRDWPLADPHAVLDGLPALFEDYYQTWQTVACGPACPPGESCDPVGHPRGSGMDKMAYDGGTGGADYDLSFESAVRSALPPRLTLSGPPPPRSEGTPLAFSVELHDLAQFPQTVGLSWHFDDGTIVVEQNASSSPAARSHVFAENGSYTVTVVAEHANGGTRSASVEVVVVADPDLIFYDGLETGDTDRWIEGAEN